MKKNTKFAVIFALLLTFVACGKQPKGNEVTSSSSEVTTSELETTTNPGIVQNSVGIIVRDMVPEEEMTTAEIPMERIGIGAAEAHSYFAEKDAERLGVSKILVMQVDASCTWNADPDVIGKFNELLVTKYGCDFVVSFLGFDMLVGEDGYSYGDILQDIKSNNQQVDIMFSAQNGKYYKLVAEDFFIDMTEYLTTTDEGTKLYKAHATEMWESLKIDDKIYAYTPYSIRSAVYTLSCNKEMADIFGLNIEKGFSFYDIGRILEKADLSNEKAEGVVPLYVNSEYLYGMLGYYDIGNGIFAKKDAEGKWVAFNGTEDEAFIKLWRLVREYKEKGWLKTGSRNYDTVTQGKFVFSADSFNMFDEYPTDNKIIMEQKTITGSKKVIYDVIYGETYYEYYSFSGNVVYGITTWSEYKSEALKFLTLINTEPELANLLTYGVENVHYAYRDNIVRMLKGGQGNLGMGESWSPVNKNITYSTYLEPENKLGFYKEQLSNYEKSPFLEYSIFSDEREELDKKYDSRSILEQIYRQGYAKLVEGAYADVDAAIAEINRIQKENGIDEYIAALNAEFKK